MGLSQRRTRIISRLSARKSREREGLVLVEGVRAVEATLDAGAEVSFAVTSPRLASTDRGRALQARLADRDVVFVEDRTLAELSDTRTSQGVLVVVAEPLGSFEGGPGDRLLVLDGVQDPGNVGTLVRAAVGFGVETVACLDGTVDPWSPKAVRASAGLVFRSRVIVASVEESLASVRAAGLPLLVADADGTDVEKRRSLARFALVVGNEGAGVRSVVREEADAEVAVRTVGPVESLNAGVAGALLMYTLTRDIADG